MLISVSQFIPPPPFPPWYLYICSLYLCLCLCHANKTIYNIFLNSTCMHQYTIFVFFLTYFAHYQDLDPSMSLQMTQFCSSLTPPFHSTQAVIELEETHPPWEGQCVLPSLSTQTLISSRNTPTDTPRIMFTQISGHSMAQPS